MNLLLSNHVKVGNKMLVLFSGFNKNAVNQHGNKAYEYNNFNIPKTWREVKWSKTMIKQLLAYAALSNSKGELGVVDLEEVADLLDCSIRSLRNNNKTYIELGLIETEELYGDLIHIKLVDYQINFLDIHPEESGVQSTGFTRIKKEALFDMFKIKNVNVLRIACRALYLHEKEVNFGGNSSVLLDSRTLKGFLPTYFSYRPVIERALRQMGRLFDVEFFTMKEDKSNLLRKFKYTPTKKKIFEAPYLLSMKLHPNRDSHKIMEEDEYAGSLIVTSGMRNFYQSTKIRHMDPKSIKELTVEYGANVVEKALKDITAYFNREFLGTSEVAVEMYKEIKELRSAWEPIGLLRKILRKYALSFQEGYLSHP